MWDEFTQGEKSKSRPEDWARVERNARDLANSVAALIGHETEAGKKELREAAEMAGEKARQTKMYLAEKGRETDRMVRESPWTAVAIAAAVGALVGSLASWKKYRE